jgi:hypothetical protein
LQLDSNKATNDKDNESGIHPDEDVDDQESTQEQGLDGISSANEDDKSNVESNEDDPDNSEEDRLTELSSGKHVLLIHIQLQFLKIHMAEEDEESENDFPPTQTSMKCSKCKKLKRGGGDPPKHPPARKKQVKDLRKKAHGLQPDEVFKLLEHPAL